MFAVINQENIVIALCDYEPCPVDLESRSEFSVECENTKIGMRYNNGNFEEVVEVVETLTGGE